MANIVADIFRQAAELNRTDPRRKGNVLEFEASCQLIVTGDIHGCRPNFAKVVEYAALGRSPQRCLILQEIIHGAIDHQTGQDRSVDLLLRAARLKIANPGQVAFLLGNHDVAQVTENEISKHGHGVCKSFKAGVEYALGDSAGEAMPAICEFLISAPLAARCPGGVFITHSLPSPERMSLAGTDILAHSGYSDRDLRRGGPAYEWTWGRGHNGQQLADLAGQLGVSFFVIGHKHIHTGFEAVGSNALILASDHPHGCIMDFAADAQVNGDNARQFLKSIASLAGGN